MKVLHVALGLPPLRTGGLTRYCIELMQAQFERGYKVALLFPGRFLPGNTRIRSKTVSRFKTYEVINPLPVPLTYGVAEPIDFMSTCDNSRAYELCLDDYAPDIIHVHSYQGIHKEFFEIAKSRGIPTVFTTHDYFPFCPRCTLVDRNGDNCCGPSAERCAVCCVDAGMTYRKSRVMQSDVYARLKQSAFARFVGSKVKSGMSDTPLSKGKPSIDCQSAYKRYLDFNQSIFESFTVVASNSSKTEEIYRNRFPGARYILAPITHAGLGHSRKVEHVSNYGLAHRIGYFGGKKRYKGYSTLCEAVRVLHESGVNFTLDLYGDDYEPLPDIPEAANKGRVAPEEISGILREHDVVVVPSIYHETCGFVVLEALCEHVPVVCSDAVGASELVSEDFVFRAGDVSDLAQKLELACMKSDSSVSIPEDYPITMDEQVHLLEGVYFDLISEVKSETQQAASCSS